MSPPEVSMAAKMSLRKAVARAVVAEAKRDGAKSVAARLDVSPRSVQLWIEGNWPNYTHALRLAPLVGIKP